MTRYDPFSFGEVSLANKQKGEKPAAAPADADDMLFADQPASKAPPGDSSWALLHEDVGNLLPGAAPELQEAMGFAGEPAATAGKRPTAGSRPAGPMGAPPPRPLQPTRGDAARSKPITQPVSMPEMMITTPVVPAKGEARSAPVMPLRRTRPLVAIVVPFALCVSGGTAAAWLWFLQQNPVMAGFAGGATLIGAAFARLLLRG
jgi:hypothetical protein